MQRLNLVPPRLPPALGDAQFRELVEGAPDGVFFANPQGRYVYVNQAGCRMLGVPRSEVIGRTAMDFVHPDEVEALEQSRLAMLTGGTHLGTWRLRQASGGWLPVEITANRLADGHSQGYVRDISQLIEQERARAELLERSE
ncbi:MAG: PAS domain-containing protein, partial [Ramlibacter sp.]